METATLTDINTEMSRGGMGLKKVSTELKLKTIKTSTHL